MIEYKDYFPRTMLNKCGILPQTKLLSDKELSNLTANNERKSIENTINSIYLNIKNSFAKTGNLSEEFDKFDVQRKIVNMLCDLDVIASVDKEKYLYFAEQKTFDNDSLSETRISIELPELNASFINKTSEKSQKVTNNSPILEIKGKQK